MFRTTLAALVVLLILSSMALAAPPCNPFTVAGSYVRQNVGVMPGNGIDISPYIDQLTLHIDGTAYWFNSGSFDLILQGAFLPEVGSWTCLPDGTVLVTTIGTLYFQNSTNPDGSPSDIAHDGQPLDINIGVNRRTTQKLSVVDLNTLQVTVQIRIAIPLGNDPLGPGFVPHGCTPTDKPCNPAPYKRIRPMLTDIP
jgi:hypothetical protein